MNANRRQASPILSSARLRAVAEIASDRRIASDRWIAKLLMGIAGLAAAVEEAGA